MDTHLEIWRWGILPLAAVCLSIVVGHAFLEGECLVCASLVVELLFGPDIPFPYRLFFQWFQKMTLVLSA